MEQITADILKFIEEGADMVVCSGGMSVDRMTELRVRSKQQEPASYPTVHPYFREL